MRRFKACSTRRELADQAVANPVHGQQVLGILGILGIDLDFLAQVEHVGVDCAGGGAVLVAPDRGEKLGPVQGLTFVFDQVNGVFNVLLHSVR